MKKWFPFIGTMVIVGCGAILHYSLSLSGMAAWSFIVSSVNGSAWELYKPVGIVYIFWIVIELSYLRPSLMHFVCSKVVGMYVLCLTALAVGIAVQPLHEVFSEMHFWIVALVSVSSAQMTGYGIYRSDVKIEILYVPLLLSILCMVFMLLFLSFYPPHWIIFTEK